MLEDVQTTSETSESFTVSFETATTSKYYDCYTCFDVFMLEDVQTTFETSESFTVSFVTATPTTSKFECIMIATLVLMYLCSPRTDNI